MKSPIVYYGGKHAIVKQLVELIPPHDVYTEAFFGGGSVLFAKSPSKNETINDKLDVVINFYEVLKKQFKPLKRAIDATLLSTTLLKRARKIIKDHRDGTPQNKIDLAWAFWFCSSFTFARNLDSSTIGYSNLKHTSSAKSFHTAKIGFAEYLAKRLESVHIECKDFEKTLKPRDVKNAFHFLDPPYFFGDENLPVDHGHYEKVFTIDDMQRLLTWCINCKGKFLLTNYDHALLNEYVTKYGWHKRQIDRRITFHNKKVKKVEVLISNYSTPCGTLPIF